MMKLIVSVCAVAMAAASAAADPDAPAPTPTGPQDEKAGANETLQNGGIERPWATGVAQTEQQSALVLFRDGNLQLNDGLFAKAADSYRAALKHWDHPAIHYNLALALMNLDQPIGAYDNMLASVHFGEAPLQSKDKYDHAKDYLLLLQKQLADVTVVCNKTGAKVSIDGQQVFTAPGTYTGKVRVGKHTFVAELEGHPTRIDAPFVSPGENFRIELKLYTVKELTRYHRRWNATWLPYAVAGGAAVLGGVGGILEYEAQRSFRDYDARVAACSVINSGCPITSSLDAAKNRGNTEKTLGQVGYGVAGATLVAAGVLWLLERPQAYQIRPEDLANEVSVAPSVAPGFAGVVAQGQF
jgi:hypothetical protein